MNQQKKRRRLLLAVAAASTVVSLGLGACASPSDESSGGTGDSEAGGHLTVRIAGAMISTDPFREIGTNPWQLLRQVYEGLVSLDDDYNPIPMLAESWDISEDGLTYTFHLRDNVTFHNDAPMTSADVVYSLEYYLENAVRASQLANITGVSATDDYTVELTLETPQANLLALLGQPIVIPVVPTGAADNDGLLNDPVGTGPFVVADFSNETRAVLERFESYEPVDVPASLFGGHKEALVDTVELLSVTEDQTAIAGIETGEYDVAVEIPVQDLDRIESIDGVTVERIGGTSMHNAYVNTAAPVTDDPNVRAAIASAIDRERLLSTTVSGEGDVSNSFVSPLVSWYDTDAGEYWPWDGGLEEAQQLLEESDYNGETLEIIAGGPANQQTNATLIGQMLEQAGFTVDIQTLDHATYQSRLNSGDFQLAATGTPLRTPADLLYNEWYCPDPESPGRFGYCDDEYNSIFEEAKQTADEDERNALFAQLERMLKDDAVVMPWYFYNSVWAVGDHVEGVEVSPSGFFNAWNVSIEQ